MWLIPFFSISSIWNWIEAATSVFTITFLGLEILGRTFVTAEIIPTWWLPRLITLAGAILPWLSSEANLGSPLKSRLAAKNVISSDCSIMSAVISGPKSKSWFPSPIAS